MKYRTAGDWGAGSASNLASADVDANFYELVGLLSSAAAARAAQARNDVTGITQDGYMMSIATTGGVAEVPVPVSELQYTGDYAADRQYYVGDYFYANPLGAYLVCRDHVSAAEFSPLASDTDGLLYKQVYGNADIFDLASYAAGKVRTGSTLLSAMSARPFMLPAMASGEQLYLRVPNSSDWGIDILLDGVAVGSISIAAYATSGVFSWDSPLLISPGMLLTLVHATGTIDTATDVSISICGVRL